MTHEANIVTFGAAKRIMEAARSTISAARLGINALTDRFADDEFAMNFHHLVDVVMGLEGRVVVTGMGKSGIVARKITATLSSTGTPAIFLHPAEAGHGDLGMITRNDIVLMLSHSGETNELTPIIQYCKQFAIPLFGITAGAHSRLATSADICILMPMTREACPNELAPTTSTTVQMAFGDALASALIELRSFSADDFYKFHPNGRLGAKLVKVRELMASGADLPRVRDDASLFEATMEMTRGRLGGAAVVDANDELVGVFTDGDLRRAVNSGQYLTGSVSRFMTTTPVTVGPEELASEALRIMHVNNITLLFACMGNSLIGAIHMHQLIKAGLA